MTVLKVVVRSEQQGKKRKASQFGESQEKQATKDQETKHFVSCSDWKKARERNIQCKHHGVLYKTYRPKSDRPGDHSDSLDELDDEAGENSKSLSAWIVIHWPSDIHSFSTPHSVGPKSSRLWASRSRSRWISSAHSMCMASSMASIRSTLW